jgi:hypothetical protein
LNTVILTSDPRAPVDTGPPDTGCTTTDTGWPCLHVNSLTREFRTEPGYTPCHDTGDSTTCVRFENGAHAYRADLDASSAATDCADVLALADGPTDTGDSEEEWREKLNTAVIACNDTLLYNPLMMNVYVINNTFGVELPRRLQLLERS